MRSVNIRGQAMTEFIILLAGVIVPFLLLMPMIAKYQDAQHQTQMASRYVAFEARTQSDDSGNWRPEDVVAREVQNRFFSVDHGSKIVSNPPSPETGPFGWTDPTHQSLLPNPSAAVVIKYGPNGMGAGTAGGFDPASDRFGRDALGNDAFAKGGLETRYLGLKGRGPFTATVEVKLNALPARTPGFMGSSFAPFDTLDMRLSARTTTLTSPWTAKDPAQVIRQMGTRKDEDGRDFGVFTLAFPSQELTFVNPYTQYTTDKIDEVIGGKEGPPRVRGVEDIGKLRAPQIGKLEDWQDVAPPDRLKPN